MAGVRKGARLRLQQAQKLWTQLVGNLAVDRRAGQSLCRRLFHRAKRHPCGTLCHSGGRRHDLDITGHAGTEGRDHLRINKKRGLRQI